MMNVMVESEVLSVGLCQCGAELSSAGAKRCPKCRAAHARRSIGRRRRAILGLPNKVNGRIEFNWIALNLGSRRVDWSSAPSRIAANLLVALNKDQRLRRAFWVAQLKPRRKRR